MVEESDLDVYAEQGLDSSKVERYLCDKEAYYLTDKRRSDTDAEVYEALGDQIKVCKTYILSIQSQ